MPSHSRLGGALRHAEVRFAHSDNHPVPRPADDALDDHLEPSRVRPDDFVFTVAGCRADVVAVLRQPLTGGHPEYERAEGQGPRSPTTLTTSNLCRPYWLTGLVLP